MNEQQFSKVKNAEGFIDSRLWIPQRRKRQLRTPRWPIGQRTRTHTHRGIMRVILAGGSA